MEEPTSPPRIASLLTEVLAELRDMSQQYNFLKKRFAELVKDRDLVIKNQRATINSLMAQNQRFKDKLKENGIEVDDRDK